MPDAAIAPPEYDPCVWDGRDDGVCFVGTAAVFDGTACRTVCGAQPALGRPGVFADEAQCRATCPCSPGKFVGFGAPFAAAGFCDALVAVTEADAGLPGIAGDCSRDALWDGPTEHSCRFGADGWFDRRAMAKACRVSALAEVHRVVCVLWVD